MAETKKSMSGLLVRVLIVVCGAVFVFTAGLVGTLGMRGKLNREYLGPLVGMPPAGSEDLDALHARLQSGSPAATPGDRDPEAAVRAAAPLLPSITLPSPFSAEETRAIFAELEATRSELRERIIRLKREEKDLELVRGDLGRRWDELNRREQELEERARLLAAERGEFEQGSADLRRELDERSILLKKAELGNLKDLAADVEKMQPQAAAALLLEKTPERAATILSFVKARESAKILGAMPPKFASTVTEKMLGVLVPEPDAPAGGP